MRVCSSFFILSFRGIVGWRAGSQDIFLIYIYPNEDHGQIWFYYARIFLRGIQDHGLRCSKPHNFNKCTCNNSFKLTKMYFRWYEIYGSHGNIFIGINYYYKLQKVKKLTKRTEYSIPLTLGFLPAILFCFDYCSQI